VNQRMQCKFKDVQSGKTLEVEFCLDNSGGLCETDISEKTEKVELIQVE